MKVIKVKEDMSLSWCEEPDPEAGNTDIIIDVCAAAVNRADLLQREGKYPPPPGAPDWMGLEVAGTVAQVGKDAPESVTGKKWQIGDRVCALLPGGGYAEKVTTPSQLVLPVPDNMSMEEAASIPEVFCTAYLNLFIEAGLEKGETILIHAGASGVGIAAIQLAKMYGAQVVTSVSGKTKVEAVRKLGADIAVDRTCESLDEVLDDCEARQQAVNVTLDCVGGEQLGRHLQKMALGGRWVLIATLGGTSTEIQLRPLLKKGLKLVGSTLRSRSIDEKAEIIRQLYENVWPGLEKGSIKPVVHAVYPINEADAAHQVLQKHENIGKVILKVP